MGDAMSKMFNFNPSEYAMQFAEEGYVHVRNGLTREFYRVLAQQVDQYLDANRLKEWAIGNKQQSLYQFPEGDDYYGEFMQAIGTVVGLDPKKLTLSERHIKAYEPNANPNPLAHKDRYASQISVGFSITVPPGSRLVLFPKDEVSVNTYNTSARLRASLTEENTPEKLLKNATKIIIEDKPGDVMIFRGNAIWHLRENPANTTNLYLKLNAFNCDPLGEDPHTEAVRKRTLASMNVSDEAFKSLVPLLGRRVDYVHRQMSRQWEETAEVVFWGDRTLPVSENEFEALKHLDWNNTVGAVLKKLNGQDERGGFAAIRRLASHGAIDLFESGST
jgi:hypothetical protein